MLLALDSHNGGMSLAYATQIHPLDAAVDAVITHFREKLPMMVKVLDSFPEHAEDMDLSLGPYLSVAASSNATYELITPTAKEVTPLQSGKLQMLWRVGYWTCNMQVDLWCSHSSERDDLGLMVEQSFDNRLPFRSGLHIESPRYYNRPVDCQREQTSVDDDTGDGSIRGEWRRIWMCTLAGDLVAIGESPRIAVLNLALTTDLSGVKITETIQLHP